MRILTYAGLAQPNSPRAVSAEQLAEVCGHHARRFAIVSDANVALETAMRMAGARDAVFITGSLYLVGQLRHVWNERAAKVASGAKGP